MARYRTFAGFFKEKYGSRLQKIVLDAGFTCPNRDGSKGRGGCTYCNNDAFHPNYSTPDKSIFRQIEEGIEFHLNRYRSAEGYLAYFQPYSNTYAPLDKLKRVYEEALSHPKVKGLVIGTRPDCVDAAKLDYIEQLSKDKIVIIEYGIESCYDKTLERINRCHNVQCAVDAVNETAARGIMQGAHFILGLPGETVEEMLAIPQFINRLPLHSIKFHQLQLVKGTAMEREFKRVPGDFVQWTLTEYIDFFIKILEQLNPQFYIERFAGEVPPRYVESTPWGLVRNPQILQMLEKRLEELDTFQGRLYKKF
ncbi:MAG: TIGR01212 family radical SAM protein [Bacteroidales bacterium]|nr:TIGR01212 family radical SAM protein [Bacteroidales bacterium]